MFKFAYNSNGLRKVSLEEALRSLAEIGYDGLELSLHESHFHPLIHPKSRIAEIRKLSEKYRLALTNLHCGYRYLLSTIDNEPSFISVDKQDRNKRIEFTKKVIDIANEIGTNLVCTASGQLKEPMSEHEATKNLIDGLNVCLDHAKENDVYLGMEPEPGMFIDTAEKAVKLWEMLKSKYFCLNLDIGHEHCAGEDVSLTINQHGSLIRLIHFEDIKDRVHKHELLGTGDIDFKEILKALRDIGFTGFISVELYAHQDDPFRVARESLGFLRRITGELR